MISRRRFNQGVVALAFAGLARHLGALSNSSALTANADVGPGPLIRDPAGLLDLPPGFSYRIISSLGDKMDDGFPVPDRADGMGCIALDNERVVLVRNHELSPSTPGKGQPLDIEDILTANHAYDTDAQGMALPGGTSNIVYNLREQRVEKQFMSLIGTVRNCSGGVTPWQSWLTCEESVLTRSQQNKQDHGYVFDVPASASGLITPSPLKAMGRFNHEAACVDPRTGIVYMTEDREDSLFYRFIPHQPGQLEAGGKLQALVIQDKPRFDTRNWHTQDFSVFQPIAARWVDLQDVESPLDDLRHRGYADGAALFARGEGIHWGNNELFFCCTNGGSKKLGQIMRYRPSVAEGTAAETGSPGLLELFFESDSQASFNYGDNVTVAPNGHLVVCEDQYTDVVNNHIKGITPAGKTYNLARIGLQTESAGACFSPDGSTLFVNLYSPAHTLAIKGPWSQMEPTVEIQ